MVFKIATIKNNAFQQETLITTHVCTQDDINQFYTVDININEEVSEMISNGVFNCID
jgi:hypothetical protein